MTILDFKKNLSSVHCALGSLMMLDGIDATGAIKEKQIHRITKSVLWSYIYYLQNYNRKLQCFASLGKKKNLKDRDLLQLVVPGTADVNLKLQTISKKDLVSFIDRASKEGLNLPFLREKTQNRVISDFNNNAVSQIEKNIDYQFRPVLYPTSFNEDNGEVKVRMDFMIEKLPEDVKKTTKKTPKK